MKTNQTSKKELFESVPVGRALAALAVPTIISQLINLVYNVVDAFFIGRTGDPYMMAATTLTLTLTMLNVAFSNLFGIGGGSLLARLMGRGQEEEAGKVSAFAVWGTVLLALTVSALVGLFLDPVLYFLGASEQTIGFARQYAFYVIVLGSLPAILSMVTAHLLRNAGRSAQASLGLSGGGLLNIALDPLFMFVLLPRGMEVTGAALATLLSNVLACLYLLFAYRRAGKTAPLRLSPAGALRVKKSSLKELFAVGIPSASLTGLFDLANIVLNILAAGHSDLTLAAMGIVVKAARLPNAVNIGICQGMMPLVAYNYASGDRKRMRETVRTARLSGLLICAVGVAFFQIFARPLCTVFMSLSAGNEEMALTTVALAGTYLRIHGLASPVQFLNYHSSFCMQATGHGKETLLHALVRELAVYIPLMFLLDRAFGDIGLAAALPLGEAVSAVLALFLLRRVLREA